ncbi:DUF2125 domain-containing protein [Sulfitobacter sp.]|uniref:DUF2125 domain-containing protein n=1 Tax=Sulfitobacter sp. TaxID=1903071 RepID=UPI0030018F39
MLRSAVKILIPIALIWAGWWYVATSGMQSSLTAWFDARRAEGWQSQTGEMTRAGFPLRIATVISDVTLDDPETQAALHLPQITLSTPIYWPGHATLRLDDAPVLLSTPQAELAFASKDAVAALRLHPSPALQLETLHGSSRDMIVQLDAADLLLIDTFRADVQQTADVQTYDIDLNAAGFAPGVLIRDALRLPQSWPERFDSLVADMTVSFDRPWDRSALEDSRPQPTAFKVDRIEAVWADLNISLNADLQIAAGGIASGTMRLKAKNWQQMLDLASASGALSTQIRPQIESGLTLLSGLSGNRESLDVEITIDQGRMRMGFIPLGTAPRLIIR